MMDVRALHTEADYKWALAEVERYFDDLPAPGTPEADRFDVLSALIKAYEDSHDDVPDADPIEVLHFAVENMGRSQKDLARIVGSRSRASEILNRKRPLTLAMIRAISAEWNLPIETLTGPYKLARAARSPRRTPSRRRDRQRDPGRQNRERRSRAQTTS